MGKVPNIGEPELGCLFGILQMADEWTRRTLAKRKAGLGSAPRVGLSLSFKSRALMTPAGIQRDQSAMY